MNVCLYVCIFYLFKEEKTTQLFWRYSNLKNRAIWLDKTILGHDLKTIFIPTESSWTLPYLILSRKYALIDKCFVKIMKNTIFEQILALFLKFWASQNFREESDYVTFLNLWSLNIVQQIKRKLSANSVILRPACTHPRIWIHRTLLQKEGQKSTFPQVFRCNLFCLDQGMPEEFQRDEIIWVLVFSQIRYFYPNVP